MINFLLRLTSAELLTVSYTHTVTEDDVGEDTLNHTASAAVGDSVTSGTAAGGGTYFEESDDASDIEEEMDSEEEEEEEDVVTPGGGGEADMMSGSDSEGVMTPAMPVNRSLNASLTVRLSSLLINIAH